MPGQRKATKSKKVKKDPKKGGHTFLDQIKEEVVAELKPHIDEIRDAAKTEIRQIRADVLNGANAAAPTAEPQQQQAAAPMNPEVITGILTSLGAKPEQISQLTSALSGLQNPAGPAAPASSPSLQQQVAAPPTPQDRQWQLLTMILPMIFGQGQGNPMLAELAQRALFDSMAFATTMQRVAVSKMVGGMAQGMGRDVAGVGVPGLEDYLRASQQYMGPITSPNLPQGNGPPTGTTPGVPK